MNLTGDVKRIGDGKYNSVDSSPSPLQDNVLENKNRSELNIIDETAERVYCEHHSSLQSHAEHLCCSSGIDAHQDYESKTLSEHNRQYVQQQRGISPVT